ncbi:MAG: hypothetical protein QW385_00550 [Thermoproteota archaeon]
MKKLEEKPAEAVAVTKEKEESIIVTIATGLQPRACFNCGSIMPSNARYCG